MSLYRYVIKTPFRKIMADMEEYRALVNRRGLLQKECAFRYKQVAKPVDNSEVVCMSRERAANKSGYNVNYCENFFKRECDKACSRCFHHDRYWFLYDELKSVVNRLDGFWDAKFQNVK